MNTVGISPHVFVYTDHKVLTALKIWECWDYWVYLNIIFCWKKKYFVFISGDIW